MATRSKGTAGVLESPLLQFNKIKVSDALTLKGGCLDETRFPERVGSSPSVSSPTDLERLTEPIGARRTGDERRPSARYP
ncbi:hypothetical protein EYF80_066106 [Liparis tanakae]|uniref:Uncharacterized protein n=1 Tax=Liparis tanakae TaxID=230148 RepID=A0A4Z2E5Z8_9TELE|nr:hypothetical protein EYF80_066106 [Liparis tanakae]